MKVWHKCDCVSSKTGRQTKCISSGCLRGREQEQLEQVRSSGEEHLSFCSLFRCSISRCLRPDDNSAACQANLTEAQDTGYNFPNCKAFRILFWVNLWARQMGEVHRAFLVINVSVAVTDYRHELMTLATKQQYWLCFPLDKGRCQLH